MREARTYCEYSAHVIVAPRSVLLTGKARDKMVPKLVVSVIVGHNLRTCC